MTTAVAPEPVQMESPPPNWPPATPLLDKLPWWDRLKIWWHTYQLRRLAKRAQKLNCVTMLGEAHVISVENLAGLVTYIEKSGALNMQPRVKQRLLDSLHRTLRDMAIGEQMASPEHYKVTLDRFVRRRILQMSHRLRKQHQNHPPRMGA